MQQPVINVHCHFLNLDCIPRDTVKLLAGVSSTVAKSTLVKHITQKLAQLYPGQQFDHIGEFLDVFQSHHIAHAARVYADEMKRAEIDMCVPLTMNLFNAASGSRDRHILEYEDQVLHTALEAAKRPWKVWPFVMFDPRRPNAFEIVEHALTRCGCIGVKMYPALGYHPGPDQTTHANDADQLRKLYDLCRDGRVPITTHASTGGAYSTELTPAQACRYTEIDNWERPIREYGLKVNFAHFGGNYIDNKASQSWRAKIINLMRRTFDGSMPGRVFADLSYQELAFDPKHKHQYFKDLKDALQDKAVAASVLFGTDWNMTAHTWRESEYIAPFRDAESGAIPQLESAFTENPLQFLFGGHTIPPSYVKFIKANAPAKKFNDLPEWIVRKGKSYEVQPQYARDDQSASRAEVIARGTHGKARKEERLQRVGRRVSLSCPSGSRLG